MKILIYIVLFVIFAIAAVVGGDYFYDQYNASADSSDFSTTNSAINSTTSSVTNSTTKNNSQKLDVAKDTQAVSAIQSKASGNKIDQKGSTALPQLESKAPPHLQRGFDWSLPSYAGEAKYSGLTTERKSTNKAVKNRFLMVLWNQANPQPGVFDFSAFEKKLKSIAPQRALVRLEVNSSCEAPDWALKQMQQTSDKSLIFWDKAYLDTTRPFIQAFAKRYAANPQIIGVQLGLADGEFGKAADSCKDYDNKNGWGEFWMSPPERQEAEQSFGFTPETFEQGTIANIDLYAKAFGKHKNKLAFTNIGTLFTYGEGSDAYNQKLKNIAHYVIDKGLGNRDGAIERWMSYTDKVYGMVFSSFTDGSCRMDFNEDFADKIEGRYWGTENEFYGDSSYVISDVGPIENGPYRFLITSLRTLQMRRNFMSITTSMDKTDHPDYKTQEFLVYLSRVLGKTKENTPDAFVLMGERYIAPYRLADQMDADCVKRDKQKVTVRSFGQWLQESPQNTQVENRPALKVSMPKSENYWYQGFYLPEGIDYEYFAREAKIFSFDVNDKLAEIRCQDGCDVEVKAIFKDTVKTSLSIEVAEGVSQNLETLGDNKIKTATFTLNSRFNNIKQNSDLMLRSGQHAIPLIMLRMNLL
ncbi:hypothetical protein [Cocleimonas flava]|nr:hypothetical protein [Cocleimonas flava]